MFKVEFLCDIGSEVTIKLTSVAGIVKGWWIDEDGIKTAHVKYADTNKVFRTAWIREDELAT